MRHLAVFSAAVIVFVIVAVAVAIVVVTLLSFVVGKRLHIIFDH